MLATLVIGLREGLEASLIVGILAAFLKRNGASLRPMWIGIAAAVALSAIVGVGLELVALSLPQAAQEGMEAVVGLVAIVFVTTMIVWMSGHSRGLKKDLEAHAGAALGEGTAWAVAGMAFLAIVKEGFETSVFLLATFQLSTSVVAAAAGAVVGIAIAVGIGVGLYQGGIRFNLGRFFKVTSLVLVLVAGGLVIGTLRSAHEAGWIDVGQARVADLSWLAPYGSVRAALVTGVLGIPADPRAIEVLGWVLFVVPMLAYLLWPARHRPAAAAVPRVERTVAAVLGVAALVLVAAVPAAAAPAPVTTVPIASGASTDADSGASAGTATLVGGALVVTTPDGTATRRTLGAANPQQHDGVATTARAWSDPDAAAGLPATLTRTALLALEGGRLPVGIDPQRAVGPFDADWRRSVAGTAWTSGDTLVDATQTASTVLTLSGGGLGTPRTLTVSGDALSAATAAPAATTASWHVPAATVTATAGGLRDADQAAAERALWDRWLPALLAVAALVLLAAAARNARRLARAEPAAAVAPTPAPNAAPTPAHPTRSTSTAPELEPTGRLPHAAP